MILLDMSVSGAMMITVIAVFRTVLRDHLPGRMLLVLWDIALLRLLIPASIPAAFSVYSLFGSSTALPLEAVFGSGSLPAAVGTGAAAATAVPDGTEPGFPLWTALWAAGSLLCGAYFLLGYFHWRRKFAQAHPVEAAFAARWLAEHRLRREIRICQTAAVTAPVSFGIFRPVILLPADTDWSDREALSYALEHEYIHIRRLDQVQKLLMTAAACLHWFNPAVWVMTALADRDLELSCDEAVIRCFGETSRAAYALALIDMAERKTGLMFLCSHFSKNPLEERIDAIMRGKRRSALLTALTSVVAVGVLAALAISGSRAEAPASGSLAETGERGPQVTVPVSTSPAETGLPSEVSAAVPVWPCPEGTVSSAYGRRVAAATGEERFSDHVCIAAAAGSPTLAALDGTVTEIGYDAPRGNYVVLSHGGDVCTEYSHLQETAVSRGDAVAAGTRLGSVGQTGMATGPCLAFTVTEDGACIDPLTWFPDRTPAGG